MKEFFSEFYRDWKYHTYAMWVGFSLAIVADVSILQSVFVIAPMVFLKELYSNKIK